MCIDNNKNRRQDDVVNYGKLDHVFIIYSCEKSPTSLNFCLEGEGVFQKLGVALRLLLVSRTNI